jgi:hypothetical protein
MRALTKPLALALAGAALLAAPAALADAAASAAPPPAATDAGSCPANAAPASLPSMEAYARLQARLQEETSAAGGEAPIVLNGRGYNYAAQRDPVREMQILQAERRRARMQR